MNEVSNKLMLEKSRFDNFMSKFKSGGFDGQRLGQAFYNELNLHKLSNQDQLKNLYEQDGDSAISLIKQIFEFN